MEYKITKEIVGSPSFYVDGLSNDNIKAAKLLAQILNIDEETLLKAIDQYGYIHILENPYLVTKDESKIQLFTDLHFLINYGG